MGTFWEAWQAKGASERDIGEKSTAMGGRRAWENDEGKGETKSKRVESSLRNGLLQGSSRNTRRGLHSFAGCHSV